ncbi:MAG: hypothetical protein RL077_1411 [Verrucomicrobiota bacterium]|jgi:hypothetical protein
MLLPKWQKYPTELLTPQLINAGVASEPEKPRLELFGGLQTIDRPDHLDEDLLRQVFNIITSTSHGVYKARHAMLVTDNEIPLGGFVPFLCPAYQIGQGIR